MSSLPETEVAYFDLLRFHGELVSCSLSACCLVALHLGGTKQERLWTCPIFCLFHADEKRASSLSVLHPYSSSTRRVVGRSLTVSCWQEFFPLFARELTCTERLCSPSCPLVVNEGLQMAMPPHRRSPKHSLCIAVSQCQRPSPCRGKDLWHQTLRGRGQVVEISKLISRCLAPLRPAGVTAALSLSKMRRTLFLSVPRINRLSLCKFACSEFFTDMSTETIHWQNATPVH